MVKARRRYRLSKCLRDLLYDSLKIVKGLFAACLAIFLLTILLWLTPFKIRPFASIRKAISQVVVFQSTPNIYLFSQYPREYELKDPKGWIRRGDKLVIRTNAKTLWLGIWNNEPITIRGVRFILFPPNIARPIDKDTLGNDWLEEKFGYEQTTQYEYKESARIYSDSGWVIAAPMKFEFPEVGTYVFKYAVLVEDFGALEDRTFIVERVQ